jgi:hypothetical protein
MPSAIAPIVSHIVRVLPLPILKRILAYLIPSRLSFREADKSALEVVGISPAPVLKVFKLPCMLTCRPATDLLDALAVFIRQEILPTYKAFHERINNI